MSNTELVVYTCMNHTILVREGPFIPVLYIENLGQKWVINLGWLTCNSVSYHGLVEKSFVLYQKVYKVPSCIHSFNKYVLRVYCLPSHAWALGKRWRMRHGDHNLMGLPTQATLRSSPYHWVSMHPSFQAQACPLTQKVTRRQDSAQWSDLGTGGQCVSSLKEEQREVQLSGRDLVGYGKLVDIETLLRTSGMAS